MVLVFASGMNFAVQLTQLLVTHTGGASWWKAGFSAVLAVMWGVFGWDMAQDRRYSK